MITSNKYFLGIDIGASSVKYGWGNCKIGLQYFNKKDLSIKSLSYLKNIISDILNLALSNPIGQNIQAIGIGTPGTIDLKNHQIVGINPNLPFLVNIDIRSLIPDNIKLPVYWDNDANLMCFAEAWQRNFKNDIVGITVGSGIGCGFVQKDNIFHGSHGYAMELGHICIIPGGEICSCKRKGCVEAYSSMDGLRRRISLLEIPFSKTEFSLNVKDLLNLAAIDPKVYRIIEEGLSILAQGIANLSVLLDPEVIVIGGGAMEGALYDWEKLQNKIKECLPSINAQNIKIEKALAGNKAGVLGAIILAESANKFVWE
ncbi:MAG: ROK family protein [Candidatus Cloacimonadaceae bacterium]|jgi:glucokinase|nr:ROK family protein [Candidatus Cloacimonadota bacterium]MCB5257537.1 ROK family protein [Candidatus Cloacimonadota bacterium]MDD5625226.1 ROK family protein [Candidatus Cloacimonadota bacterium]